MLNPSICTRECDRRCKNEKCLNNCTKHAANISEVTCQDKSFNNTTINIISPKHIYHLFFVLLLLPTVVIIVYKYCMTVELIFLGIYFNKTNDSPEYEICYHSFCIDFSFQLNICAG